MIVNTGAKDGIMRYVYDGDGRLKYLKEDTDTILTEYCYTDAGRIKEIITNGGIRTSYNNDEDGNISRLTNEDRNSTGERYAYDLCGNRLLNKQYSGSSVDVTEGYRYNERNELTERIRAGRLIAYHAQMHITTTTRMSSGVLSMLRDKAEKPKTSISMMLSGIS